MPSASDAPLIVIPDTHGHVARVDRLVRYFQKEGYLRDHRLAFLGDYVDRGPAVRELIEYAIHLADDGHVFIAGNHEYVLERICNATGSARLEWIKRWAVKYESRTLMSYGVREPFGKKVTWSQWFEAADELRRAIPASHRLFIEQLPFYHETDDLLLVHAGLEPKIPWPTQRAALRTRNRRSARGPAQLFSHELAGSFEHPAPKTLVTGHVTVRQPLSGPRRLLLSCGVDLGGPLVAWVSDQNKCFKV